MPIRKILLFDDDREELEIFSEAIHVVDSSIEVCQITTFPAVFPTDPSLCPDLIFLDINMPGEDGFEALHRMKVAGCEASVVMYSTSSSAANVQQAYQQGASLYLSKPWRFDQLVQALQTILHLDWSAPEKVRATYLQNGRYIAFG